MLQRLVRLTADARGSREAPCSGIQNQRQHADACAMQRRRSHTSNIGSTGVPTRTEETTADQSNVAVVSTMMIIVRYRDRLRRQRSAVQSKTTTTPDTMFLQLPLHDQENDDVILTAILVFLNQDQEISAMALKTKKKNATREKFLQLDSSRVHPTPKLRRIRRLASKNCDAAQWIQIYQSVSSDLPTTRDYTHRRIAQCCTLLRFCVHQSA
jgi:hypothetical protein